MTLGAEMARCVSLRQTFQMKHRDHPGIGIGTMGGRVHDLAVAIHPVQVNFRPDAAIRTQTIVGVMMLEAGADGES